MGRKGEKSGLRGRDKERGRYKVRVAIGRAKIDDNRRTEGKEKREVEGRRGEIYKSNNNEKNKV